MQGGPALGQVVEAARPGKLYHRNASGKNGFKAGPAAKGHTRQKGTLGGNVGHIGHRRALSPLTAVPSVRRGIRYRSRRADAIMADLIREFREKEFCE